MRYVSIVILAFHFIVSCAPPVGWKDRSRLFGPSTHSSSKNFKGSKNIRVMIYQGNATGIASEGAFEFRSSKNEVVKSRGVFVPTAPGKFVSEKGEFTLNKNKYYGDVMIYEENRQFTYVNIVPLEEYLVSVVGHEMSPKWPLDALKAQAVVARTYALQKVAESADKLYDIGGTTKDQVYSGNQDGDEVVRRAVRETLSQVITYKGEIAKVFYHSCCGGQTASSSEVWKEDLPYLPQKECKFTDSPEYNWELVLTKKEVEDRLGLSGISKIVIKERTESKRVKSIGIVAGGKSSNMPAAEFRTRLGVEKLRSTRFGMKISGNRVVIKGHGYGHGVGLCQWCSKIMAEKRSMKYQSILRYFFPGTKVTRI